MALSNENNPAVTTIHVGSITADGVLPAMYCNTARVIKSVKIINGAEIAESDVNYVLVNLQIGDVDVATYDSRAAGNGILEANTGKAMTLVAAQASVAAGSTLTVVYDEEGTVAMTDAVIVIEHYAK